MLTVKDICYVFTDDSSPRLNRGTYEYRKNSTHPEKFTAAMYIQKDAAKGVAHFEDVLLESHRIELFRESMRMSS